MSESLSERHGLKTPMIVSHHVILANSHIHFIITATRGSIRTHKWRKQKCSRPLSFTDNSTCVIVLELRTLNKAWHHQLLNWWMLYVLTGIHMGLSSNCLARGYVLVREKKWVSAYRGPALGHHLSESSHDGFVCCGVVACGLEMSSRKNRDTEEIDRDTE